ncbi:hypothetical protein AVEN_193761-1 [Araneus ventricosus]|uniref:Uncharacterized protein n=1 Tax=Araneus ventricosus TaxID=182803 RepID=A0A4Y2DN79_ARAVE|nr:hypothetical protein AVEN_193761-1 [Araneus ventricosus]
MLATVVLKLHEKLAYRRLQLTALSLNLVAMLQKENRKTKDNFFKAIRADPEARWQAKMPLLKNNDEIQLQCVSRTIRNVLHRNPKNVYKKLNGKPPLSKRHIVSLINFVRDHLTAGTNWNDVAFSDENMFYLNDLDRFKFSW